MQMYINENGEVEYKDLSDICVENVKKDGFDCIFTLGGDGTQKSARDFALKGLNVIGVPKTIDNDVACTEITFGYNTAVSVAMEAIDRLHTTGETHHRIMVLEVMGRYAGWIALEAAIAGGADAALIPEIPYDIEKVAEKIKNRQKRGKNFSVIVVSEGAMPKGGTLTVEGTRDNGKGVDNTKLGGVGPKVADCIMLFSTLKCLDVFPIDVWVRRVMNELYFQLPEEKNLKREQIEKLAYEKYGNLAGIAQQYLFYWKREA